MLSDSISIGLATSSDGGHWEKHPSSPVLSRGPAGAWDARHVSGPEVQFTDGMLRMWYEGSDISFLSTGLAVSADGVSWAKDVRNPVLSHGSSGAADARQAGIIGITKREGLLYLLYWSIDDAGAHSYSLATSRDGIDWSKWPGNPVKRGEGWDGTSLGGGTILWKDGQFHLWYSGATGTTWGFGEAISPLTTVAVPAGESVPNPCMLQTYPNPFNPTTLIRFSLARRSPVIVTVLNALGQEIATIANGELEAGNHEVALCGTGLASGMYFCRMRTGDVVQMRRPLLLR